MEVDMLKIDGGMVAASEDSEGAVMLKAIIQLAHNLGIWAVAEGVETREQYEVLRAAGCRYGQGWFFGKAVTAETLSEHRVPASPIPAA
jgi:EAL domain-containing protein (putative c-di-GMP-specific phosphodiesterase class I)